MESLKNEVQKMNQIAQETGNFINKFSENKKMIEDAKNITQENETFKEELDNFKKSLKDAFTQKEKMVNGMTEMDTRIEHLEAEISVVSERSKMYVDSSIEAKENLEKNEDVTKTCAYDINVIEKLVTELTQSVKSADNEIKS